MDPVETRLFVERLATGLNDMIQENADLKAEIAILTDKLAQSEKEKDKLKTRKAALESKINEFKEMIRTIQEKKEED